MKFLYIFFKRHNPPQTLPLLSSSSVTEWAHFYSGGCFYTCNLTDYLPLHPRNIKNWIHLYCPPSLASIGFSVAGG